MDRKYSTIIFVPHARAKFRKLKVSHRLLISLMSVVTSSLCLSTFFSIQYFTSLSQTHELSQLRHENKELQTANEQLSKSFDPSAASFTPWKTAPASWPSTPESAASMTAPRAAS